MSVVKTTSGSDDMGVKKPRAVLTTAQRMIGRDTDERTDRSYG